MFANTPDAGGCCAPAYHTHLVHLLQKTEHVQSDPEDRTKKSCTRRPCFALPAFAPYCSQPGAEAARRGGRRAGAVFPPRGSLLFGCRCIQDAELILLAGSAEDKSGSGRRMLRVSWEPSEETRVVDTVEPHQVWVLGLLTQVSFQLTKNKL